MNREFIIKTRPYVGKDGKVHRDGSHSSVSTRDLTREDAIRLREEFDKQDLAGGFGINEEEYRSFLTRLESLPWRDQLELPFEQKRKEVVGEAAE